MGPKTLIIVYCVTLFLMTFLEIDSSPVAGRIRRQGDQDGAAAPDVALSAPDDAPSTPDDAPSAPDDATNAPNDATNAPNDATNAPNDETSSVNASGATKESSKSKFSDGASKFDAYEEYSNDTESEDILSNRAGLLDYEIEFYPSTNNPLVDVPENGSESELTPFAFPNNNLSLGYGEACTFYGSDFRERQKTSDFVPKKVEAISQFMCKLNLRLECVPLPNQPAGKVSNSTAANSTVSTTSNPSNTTVPSTSTTKLTTAGPRKRRQATALPSLASTQKPSRPTGAPSNPPANATTPGAPSNPPANATTPPEGKCVCARSLGNRAVYIKPSKKTRGGCFIPAGLGRDSECDTEAALPYGDIDDGTIHRKTFGNGSELCVPNAECRTGNSFIGHRCMCIEKAKWKKRGICLLPGETMDGANDLKSSINMIFAYLSIFLMSFALI